ncbi:hypothetical protein TNCV_1906001 [Trichonephila clavipes]|nr:hypothetical protein TNCV_1906001 [Trichonephila clavipes]
MYAMEKRFYKYETEDPLPNASDLAKCAKHKKLQNNLVAQKGLMFIEHCIRIEDDDHWNNQSCDELQQI